MTSSVKLPSWLLLAKTFTGGGSCDHDGNIDDEDKIMIKPSLLVVESAASLSLVSPHVGIACLHQALIIN